MEGGQGSVRSSLQVVLNFPSSFPPVIIFLPPQLVNGGTGRQHCVEVCLDLSAFDLLMTWAYVHGETACNYFKLQQIEPFTQGASIDLDTLIVA